jgi:thiol-disulfide isomerase/thioredoxin
VARGPAALRVTDGSGRLRSLGEEAGGRPVAVHLWATWCAPCLTELPRLAAAVRARPDLAGRILVVSVDTIPNARVAAFLDRLDVALPSLQLVEGNAGAAFGLRAYPATVVLDAAGGIVRRHEGPLDWGDEAAVDALLAP